MVSLTVQTWRFDVHRAFLGALQGQEWKKSAMDPGSAMPVGPEADRKGSEKGTSNSSRLLKEKFN